MTLYVGATAPLASTIVTTSTYGETDSVTGLASTAPDLTTVTSAAWEVALPGGAIVSWAASIVGAATATRIVTRHTHDVADMPRAGKYSVRVLLSTPSGVVRSDPHSLSVLAFPLGKPHDYQACHDCSQRRVRRSR